MVSTLLPEFKNRGNFARVFQRHRGFNLLLKASAKPFSPAPRPKKKKFRLLSFEVRADAITKSNFFFRFFRLRDSINYIRIPRVPQNLTWLRKFVVAPSVSAKIRRISLEGLACRFNSYRKRNEAEKQSMESEEQISSSTFCLPCAFPSTHFSHFLRNRDARNSPDDGATKLVIVYDLFRSPGNLARPRLGLWLFMSYWFSRIFFFRFFCFIRESQYHLSNILRSLGSRVWGEEEETTVEWRRFLRSGLDLIASMVESHRSNKLCAQKTRTGSNETWLRH